MSNNEAMTHVLREVGIESSLAASAKPLPKKPPLKQSFREEKGREGEK